MVVVLCPLCPALMYRGARRDTEKLWGRPPYAKVFPLLPLQPLKGILVNSRDNIPQLDQGFPSFGINPEKCFKLLVCCFHSSCGEQRSHKMC